MSQHDTLTLEPCPFCGAQPEQCDVGDHVVTCPSCGVDGPYGAPSGVAGAIQGWNRRAALSATQLAQAAQGEPVQGVPDGWEIREDDTWIYFKRPDGFCQAVTPNDPHTSHAQTLHMLMRAMLTASPTPPAQPAVAQGAGEVVAWLWKYIGRDPYAGSVHGAADGYIARSVKEMNPENPPYPDTWKPVHPLTYAYTQPAAGADVSDMVEIMALADSYRNATCQEATASAREWLRAAIAASGRKS